MSSDPVYLGFWIDQSAGTVLGSTLTTTSRTGNLIVAFLAVFVSAAGSACCALPSINLGQPPNFEMGSTISNKPSGQLNLSPYGNHATRVPPLDLKVFF
jgi:hypothetical protein